jgi:hypothetical protein
LTVAVGNRNRISNCKLQIANRKSAITMSLPSSFIPVRHRTHRKRRDNPGVPSPLLAHVLEVFVLDDTGALWVFDSPVTVAAEGEPCPQLRIQTASGWQSASSVGRVGTHLLACDYDSGDLSTIGGDPWEIVSAPVGISFGAGVSLALPEGGVTVR